MSLILRYATVTDLRNRNILDTDDHIAEAIFRSEEVIDLICRRNFDLATLAFDQDGSGTDTLLVERYPIQSITLLTYRYGNWGSSQTVDLDNNIIIKSEEGTIVHRLINWPEGDNNIHIEGTFGELTVPELIKEATILLAMSGGGSGISLPGAKGKVIVRDLSLQSETIGNYSYTRKAGAGSLGKMSTGIDAVDRILWNYRREPFLKAVGRKGSSSNESSVLRRVVGDS